MKRIIFAISIITLCNIQFQTFASQPSKSGGVWALAKPIIAGAGTLWGTGIVLISGYKIWRAPKDAQCLQKIKNAVTQNGDSREQTIKDNVNSLSWFYADKEQKELLCAAAKDVTDRAHSGIASLLLKHVYPSHRRRDSTEEYKAKQFVHVFKDIEKEVHQDSSTKGKRKLISYATLGVAAVGGGIWLLKKR